MLIMNGRFDIRLDFFIAGFAGIDLRRLDRDLHVVGGDIIVAVGRARVNLRDKGEVLFDGAVLIEITVVGDLGNQTARLNLLAHQIGAPVVAVDFYANGYFIRMQY